MKRAALILMVLSNIGRAQAVGNQAALIVTRIYGVTSSWPGECGPGALDNRSPGTRNLNYHAVAASGSGTWTVTIEYSDTSCTGPWTMFGTAAQIDQTSTVPIASGFGYHPFIKIVVTGSATATYSGEKDFFISPIGSGGGGGGVTFPITIPQGGTGASTAAGARSALGVAASGVNADITALTALNTPIPAAALPFPTVSTLGGVKAFGAVLHNFLTGIGTNGTPTAAQPTAADVAGLAASATIDTTNASNITSGTLPAGRLPNPGIGTKGGVQAGLCSSSSQVVGSINTDGSVSCAPAVQFTGTQTPTAFVTTASPNVVQNPFALATLDPSGNATFASVTTGPGSSVAGFLKLTNGTFPGSAGSGQIVFTAPTAVTTPYVIVMPTAPGNGCLTGTNSSGVITMTFGTCGAGNVTSVFGRTGVVTAQTGDYSAGQITGLAASATTDTTNAANITSGTLPGGRLPAFSGDISSSAGSTVLNLATVNTSPGVCGDGSHICQVTVNSKGLVTATTTFAVGTGVLSFNGRSGAVVPTTGDYTATQISGLAASATIDTTNAANITGGRLALARGGTHADLSATGGTSQVLKQTTVGGDVTVGQLAAGDISGLAASATTDTTNASNISSGTLANARLSANVVLNNTSNSYTTGNQSFSSATSLTVPNGAGAAPTLSGSVAYDTTANRFVGGQNGNTLNFSYWIGTLPVSGNCVAWSSNGAQSDTGSPCGTGGTSTVTSVFGRTGAVTAQSGDYSAGQITGLAASATTDTTNAANITSGTLPAARLPNPTSGTLGGVESFTAPTHQFLVAISTSGVPSAAQPTASDISGLAASATTDTTNAANISSGLLALARGGTHADLSATGGTSQVLKQTTVGGNITVGQLAAGDISGLAASATTDTTNASNITSGTLASARLPNPAVGAKGGVQSNTCSAGSALTSINTDSTSTCTAVATVPVTASNGGTGSTSFTAGDMLVASGSTTLSKVNNVQQVVGTVNALLATAAGGCGLVGDGTTDDSAALATCISTQLSANPTGIKILFPSGKYGICGLDISSSFVILEGVGMGENGFFNTAGGAATILQKPTTCSASYIIRLGTTSGPVVNQAGIKNLGIDANGIATGIWVRGARGFNVENVSVTRFGAGAGILVDSNPSGTISGPCGNGSGPGSIRNVSVGASPGGMGSGIHFQGHLNTSDVCSIEVANVNLLHSGRLNAHGLWLEDTDSDRFVNVATNPAGDALGSSNIFSFTVSSGTATVVLTSSQSGISGGDHHGIFLSNVLAASCTGSAIVGLNGNFTATFTNSTTFTFPTTAANGTYCLASGGTLMGAGVEVGNSGGVGVWDTTTAIIQSAGGIHSFSNGSINATTDNLIVGQSWEELCGGYGYTCMAGIFNSYQPMLMNSGDFGNFTLNGTLYGRDPVTPGNRNALIAPAAGGGIQPITISGGISSGFSAVTLKLQSPTVDTAIGIYPTVSGGHAWQINAPSTGSSFTAGALVFNDISIGATRMQIDGSGNVTFPGMSGGGKTLVCMDNSGTIYRASGTSCP